ncbi:unnamed protein product, partial [Hymenolepis diminuta]
HTLLLRCSPIAFVPYHSLTRQNRHCGLINTFWPSQLLVLWFVTVVPVVSYWLPAASCYPNSNIFMTHMGMKRSLSTGVDRAYGVLLAKNL